MKQSVRFTVISILFCLVVFISSGLLAQYKVGDTVTNFRLKDTEGKFHMLNMYKGNIILLNFFATW